MPSESEQARMVEAALLIIRRSTAKPLLDERTPDEIIGYDEHGLPC